MNQMRIFSLFTLVIQSIDASAQQEVLLEPIKTRILSMMEKYGGDDVITIINAGNVPQALLMDDSKKELVADMRTMMLLDKNNCVYDVVKEAWRNICKKAFDSAVQYDALGTTNNPQYGFLDENTM